MFLDYLGSIHKFVSGVRVRAASRLDSPVGAVACSPVPESDYY